MQPQGNAIAKSPYPSTWVALRIGVVAEGSVDGAVAVAGCADATCRKIHHKVAVVETEWNRTFKKSAHRIAIKSYRIGAPGTGKVGILKEEISGVPAVG